MTKDMAPADLLIPLDVPPSDARLADDTLQGADTVVLRLRSMPVANLPEHLDVGGVRIDFMTGPRAGAAHGYPRERRGSPARPSAGASPARCSPPSSHREPGDGGHGHHAGARSARRQRMIGRTG
jgi:hypothetical protein